MKRINTKLMLGSLLTIATILFLPTSVFAANTHTHDARCYSGTQHICQGSPTEFGACYTQAVYEYHSHTGIPNSSTPNGCYTKEVKEYHVHQDTCYQTTEVDCQHTISMQQGQIMDYFVCPNCGEVKFYGYKTYFTCPESNTSENIYAGECLSCHYTGNATIASVIIDDKPATLSYTHKRQQKDLICGKTTETVDGVHYELNCGKTTDTIEKTTYIKTCGKTNGAYYDKNGNMVNTPQCNRVVVDIAPKTQYQTTKTPDFTLIATFLDGHKQEINPTLAVYDSNMQYDKWPIELSYTGEITKVGNNGTLITYMYLTTPKEATPIPTPTVTPTPTIKPTPTVTPIPTKIVTPIPTVTPIVVESTPIITPVQETTTIPTLPPLDNSNSGNNTNAINEQSQLNTPEDLSIISKDDNKEQDLAYLVSNGEKENTIDLIASNNDNNKEDDTENKILLFFIIAVIILLIVLIGTLIVYIMLSKKEKNDESDDDYNDDDFDL